MIKGKNFAGFTLIELLVVIAIIGILATISIATFNNYISESRNAKNLIEKADTCKHYVVKCLGGGNECMNYEACNSPGEANFNGNTYVSFPIPSALIKKISLRAKINDTQFVLFTDNVPSGRYIGASRSGNGLYSSGSSGSPVFKVDGAIVTSLIPFHNDGNYHNYEITNLNLGGWNPLNFAGYLTSYGFVGTASDIKFYDAGGELLGSYFLNESSGTVATDTSGNDYHGTAINITPATFWSNFAGS